MSEQAVQIIARGPRAAAEAAARAMDDDPVLEWTTYSIIEEDEAAGRWRIDAFPVSGEEAQSLRTLLAGFAALTTATETLADADWLAMALSGLPPVRAGRFFVFGVHDRGRAPLNTVNLRIEAGAAFGTGHHGTTVGCLIAYDALRKGRRFDKMLDVGTGTGVLAIAAARTGSRISVGTDIDRVSVRIARENAMVNSADCRFVHADGLAHRAVAASAPYDLVFANILARPLTGLAQAIKHATRPGGAVILSGLLRSQARTVLAAYRSRGLRLTRRLNRDAWTTLVLRRYPSPPMGVKVIAMRQTFDETTDPSFGPRHAPLIRQAMAAQGLDGFVIPHEDEHQNEYLPAANDRLAWATGFTGSAGAAVILKDKAAVFVDGRYTLQVRDQVDGETFEFRDLVEGGVPAYLGEMARSGWTIGYDARLHSPDALERLSAAASKAGAALKPVEVNPLDQAWGAARPPQPTAAVVPHPLEFAGESSSAKRARVGASLAEAKVGAAIITAPASIAWLFNIRGGDVIRSPLPLAQAILNADGTARLFLDPAKVTADLPAWLGNEVRLEGPAAFKGALADLKGQRVSIDPGQSAAWYFETLAAAGAEPVRASDPCALPRACKNAVEIEGARRAHHRDGAALTRFLHWIATEAQETLPDEVEIVSKLEGFREATGALKDLSFDTIAGAAANGAIVHYRPTHRLNRRVERGSLLLVDSGAQYLDGTTDVTRTLAIGEPTAEMRQRFTLVLKGHLALARVRFPAGTTGSALDALARVALWSAGFDYDHGTGHGVGSYLGVHEGPHRIAKIPNTVPLMPGMIVSNEPGYYKQGAYGIRIETLQVVTEPALVPGGERPMLGFETLTLAPIDGRLVDVALLSGEERTQLNAYHERVLDEIGQKVPTDVAAWLQEACAPI